MTLVDAIQRSHTQVAGTAEEGFLLAGNQGNDDQVVLPEVSFSLEQLLQQMQAAAAAIVASKEGIQQCSVVLHEFPMAKYTQYIELKGQEIHLKHKDVHLNKEQLEIDSNRFGLKQKEDEHPMRVDGDRAELEDRSAKRRRFNSSTDDGITSEACLQRPQKGLVMHSVF